MGPLLPLSARVEGNTLTVGEISMPALADELGTPLVVYCGETLRAQARAYRAVDPEALVVYGTKAFANVALLRLLAEEGIGADVSTLGELEFASRAGIPADRIVFHGNNKSDAELAVAAERDIVVVLDAEEELERAAAAGVRRALVRLNPEIEVDTHRSIQTGHVGSKFGLDPEQALGAIAAAPGRLDLVGVHVHVGSQLTRPDPALAGVDRLLDFCDTARDRLGWTPRVIDVGGGLGVRHVSGEIVPEPAGFAPLLARRVRERQPGDVQLILEPGRSLVGRAGVTLYRVGATKRSGGVDYAAVDGGMSDNPRPQLYDARYEPLLANRAAEEQAGSYRIAGKHCESGDILVEDARLPRPRRGDVLALPATGAYTLAMASTYNGVPRPAAALVENGRARLIRRREAVEDLLAFEEDGEHVFGAS